MKRWAVLVVLLYLLILVVLTAPLIVVAFYPSNRAGLELALEPLLEWGYWAALVVFVAAQAVMLIVPVELSLGRPTSQR